MQPGQYSDDCNPHHPHPLISILSKVLPDLIAQRARSPGLKPVRLLVIDALTDLFFASDKASTGTLIERSQNIVEISSLLHSLASAHDMIILVLNNTTDIFQVGDRAEAGSGEELQYKQQSRWFGGAASIPGESSKEASLGLAWANQINARIMMSRTGRRRFLDHGPNKRQKVSESSTVTTLDPPQDDWTMLRRLSVVFSSVAPACSLDYIISAGGVCILSDGETASPERVKIVSDWDVRPAVFALWV
jgi:DNA repair protein RAD57